MNWTIEHIDEDGYVLVETEGHFTEADSQAMLNDLFSQPFWKPDTNVLFDSRRRKFGDSGLEYVRRASRYFLKFNDFIGCGKIALLMKSETDCDLGREFIMLVDEELCVDVRIFLNEILAVNWVSRQSFRNRD